MGFNKGIFSELEFDVQKSEKRRTEEICDSLTCPRNVREKSLKLKPEDPIASNPKRFSPFYYLSLCLLPPAQWKADSNHPFLKAAPHCRSTMNTTCLAPRCQALKCNSPQRNNSLKVLCHHTHLLPEGLHYSFNV